ncbi:tripartite tricarboxylate transporter permease [Metabacillus arenae]|uniref:Tripartite tricarboxylate transporter permease n=1 Tax=Metabacillus arenae TaxID=2771434 RepID=A0A926NLG5_9BACI|nr:tripartite tricarboxylate transporter permease [Metabacillus arenae]MBD1382875.1 tripartite tricarboxylate transporter permease [Metabacillus arenae]
MMEGLLGGLSSVLQPVNLLILVVATLIGFLGGAIPGISGTMLVIILLPITYTMDPAAAFLLLTAIYASSVFSGSISAILFRTPGTPEAIATVFDGYPMAQKGQAGTALGVSIFSSAIGGLIGTIFLIFLTPLLAQSALKFSSPEYFALAVLGLTVVASLSGGDLIKGLIAVLIGLFLATFGLDALTGTERFTFGEPALLSGIGLIPVLIGLFAISEFLRKSREQNVEQKSFGKIKTKIFEIEIFKRIYKVIARSSLLGVFIGILPGVGATTASILSYSEAVRWSKNKKEYGTGIPEGVSAPETANNAAAVGAMVPLLALGIPGSATTAVILGAFILHGMQPGPMLFNTNKELMYTIFIGILVANLLILILSKPFIRLFSKITVIPYHIMGPIIVILCTIGTFSVRNSYFDVMIMFLFGILGYLFEKIKLPLAPIILGLVLGPIGEAEFRRSLEMSSGDYSVFFTRPISVTLLAIALIALIFPLIKARFRKKNDENTGIPT